MIANQRDAHTQALAFGNSRRFEYMVKGGDHKIWDISVGREIPIGVWLKNTSPGWIDCGGWALGVWIPLSFHMVEDFNDDSNPIINNDYRFAGALKVGHALTHYDVLSGKFQFGHENTHLGDEFTIHALDQYPATFRRINVSYEYFEVGVNIDHLYGANRDHRVAVRVSGIRTADFLGDPGWY